ncbi:SprT-like domain-containing protein [Streptomyces gobiensis]|uniref:SprT-like domain-containing protein n=1 Tax=Streptomyces gobiensis TaxID=2875706 RepID=UPI003BAE93C8
MHWSGRLPVVTLMWVHGLPCGALAMTTGYTTWTTVRVSAALVPGGSPAAQQRLRDVLLHESIHVACGPWCMPHGRRFARHARRLSQELGLRAPCRATLANWPQYQRRL